MHAHYPAAQIVSMLEERTKHCGRHVPRREVVAAVQDALETAWQPSGSNVSTRSAPKWPEPNREQIEAITKDGPTLGGLSELSPFPMKQGESESWAEWILEYLFPGNPLLCCGLHNYEFDTKPLEQWRGELHRQQLIVPSAMSAITGLTKDGKESKHTLNNTGPRRFLIVEFDKGTFDQHAALLWHLSRFAPLAMAVHSGSKSLHGWFYVQGRTDDNLTKLFRYAVSLGADYRLWTKSQFCRMPDGTRDNGKIQRAHYFNPLATKEGQ
jgi:hypothetical protein